MGDEESQNDADQRLQLGLRLKAARENVKLTQEEVGEKVGLGKAAVSAWEKGRSAPGSLTLKQLAKMYHQSADALLWDTALSKEALQIAAEFDNLPDAKKSAWRLLWLGYMARASEAGELLPPAPPLTMDSSTEEDHTKAPPTPRKVR